MSEQAKPHPVRFDKESGQLVTTGPLCADQSGKLVPCDSPEANTQVVGPGVPVPPALVKRYGLKAAAEPEPEQPVAQPGPRARPPEPTPLPAEEKAETRSSKRG